MYSLTYQDNDPCILKLRDSICKGKVGVCAASNGARQLSTVNHQDQLMEKRVKIDPSVSTGALRMDVNSVKA